jgi:hypothetical protein
MPSPAPSRRRCWIIHSPSSYSPSPKLVVPDPALRVCEVDGRPIPVGEGAPHPVVAVERDRVLDSHRLHGLADVLDLALERELGRMDADDDEPEVAVFRGPRAPE